MRIALKLKHAVQAFLPVALLVTFTGCQTVPDEDAENQQPKPLPFSKLSVPKAELIDDSPLEVEEMEKKETTEIKREDRSGHQAQRQSAVRREHHRRSRRRLRP